MRIGEDVFTVQAGRKWSKTSNSEENRPDGGNSRWPNDVMCVLAKRAIRVPDAVRVEMH